MLMETQLVSLMITSYFHLPLLLYSASVSQLQRSIDTFNDRRC